MAGFILYGLVLYSLMPKFSQEAVKSAEQYGASAGLGVLVLFGVPIAACIACITVVGLFIGISTLFVWYAALYFAQIIVGTVVGQWLMGRTGERSEEHTSELQSLTNLVCRLLLEKKKKKKKKKRKK